MQVFGKLAKGAAVLNATSNESIVQQLLHRVKETSVLSEKRSALHDLKELLQNNLQEKGVFGSINGIPTLIEVLTENDDLEIIQLALETLQISCTDEGTQISSESLTNCEMLIQSFDHLAVILSFLEPESDELQDFYVYYHVVQILNRCVKTNLYKIQEAVSKRGNGLLGLLRMLSEREVIRNETLLILIQLTANYPGLQTAAAVGGIFEKLFQIARSEGAAEGGIIVHDCIELMLNVLNDNVLAQKHFRNGGFFKDLLKCMELVDVSTQGADALLTANHNLSPQTIDNLKIAIQLTEILICAVENEDSDISTKTENCVALNEVDCLPVFSQLCLNQGGVNDSGIRIKALRCMSSVLSLAPDSKKLFIKLRVFLNSQPREVVVAALKIALGSNDREEAIVALHVLESFFDSNQEAQERAISAIIPIPGRSATSGALIVDVLQALDMCKEGSEQGRKAVIVLSYLIQGNSIIQQALLLHKMPLPHGQEPCRVLDWLMRLLSHCFQFGTNPLMCQSLSECVMNCIDGCPAAVEALLQEETHIALLVNRLQDALQEVSSTRSWRLGGVGYVSVLLAVCLATVINQTEHPNSEALREYLKNVVATSADVDSYLSLLSAIHDKASGPAHKWLHRRIGQILPVVQSCLHSSHSTREQINSFATVLQDSTEEISHVQQSMNEGTQIKEDETVDLNAERSSVAATELAFVKQQLSALETEHLASKRLEEDLRMQISQQEEYIQELRSQNTLLRSSAENGISTKTRDELFVCIGIEHAKVQTLSAKLLELGYDPDAILAAEMDQQL